MKIKDLKEGMKFKITSEDDPELITEGAIVDIWSMRAGNAWGVQFDDEVQTFTWGKDEDDLAPCFELIEG